MIMGGGTGRYGVFKNDGGGGVLIIRGKRGCTDNKKRGREVKAWVHQSSFHINRYL